MRKAAGEQVLGALRRFWDEPSGGGRLFLAVSGGVDSMVLLEGVARLCEKLSERQRVVVVHVNHGLRGQEADGDEYLVLARARELGFESRSFRLEWAGELPSQDRCRLKREKIFQDLCSHPGDRMVLAHHLNDQAETVLFRLIRGTGARGLRGMLPVSGRKLRPFLGTEKAVLAEAAREWGVCWREDSSNADPEAYERNWLRSLFPLIEGRRPGFQRKLAALAEEARHWSSDGPLKTFAFQEGILFARPERGCRAAVLNETFRLGRRHSQELEALLGRRCGRLHAARVRFAWSAGVLLVERRASFRAVLVPSPESGELSSSLGRWRVGGAGRSGLLAAGERGGDRVKKEFQDLGVPVFFRAGVPLLCREGRPVALLPRRLDRLGGEGISFEPSSLGLWWLGGG